MYKITYNNFNNLKQTGGAKSENIKLISEIITSDIPNHLMDPILFSLFYDPVVASDGNTYERTSIVKYMRTNTTSPMSREVINNIFYPNNNLKEAIINYIIENKWTYEYNLEPFGSLLKFIRPYKRKADTLGLLVLLS